MIQRVKGLLRVGYRLWPRSASRQYKLMNDKGSFAAENIEV